MGYLKHKYTEEYFTGHNENGEAVRYGAEGYDTFLNGKVRDFDLSILSRVDWRNKRVLEFGFGRGEAIKYVMDNGAKSYEGVDFAHSAYKIAKNLLKRHKIRAPILHNADALVYLQNYIQKYRGQKTKKFDIVLMLDFIEHIPRNELRELLRILKIVLIDKAVIVINTPNFRFDNDVAKDGLDDRNNVDTNDTSDLVAETRGMHCNKYSVTSLQLFMRQSGYNNISENHFFIQTRKQSGEAFTSYEQQWNACYSKGYPIAKTYHEDVIEYAYKIESKPERKSFSKGRLRGIQLLLTDYYQNLAFPHGEHDEALFSDLETMINGKKTIFDVGGFMGVSSLLFSKTIGGDGTVISFEPNPYNLNRMLLNFSINPQLGKNISAYNIALGNKVGKADFFMSGTVDNGHSSTSRLDNTHAEHDKGYLSGLGFFNHTVKIDTLDHFISRTHIVPDIIKVDIEGAEHQFLLGALETLKNASPTLYIELHSQFCALLCTQILMNLGYNNKLLIEEPDNRILVKFFKSNDTKSGTYDLNSIDRIEFEALQSTLGSMERKTKHYQNELANKTMIIAGLTNNIEALKSDLNRITTQSQHIENYVRKLMNNPIIKVELALFRVLKKTIRGCVGHISDN